MNHIKPIDLLLQLLEAVGERLHVEPAEQGLVEAFVLSLRGRLIGFDRDRLDPGRGDIGDELTEDPASGRVQRSPVIAEETLRNTMSRDAFGDNGDRSGRGFARGDMAGDRESRMIVDEFFAPSLAHRPMRRQTLADARERNRPTHRVDRHAPALREGPAADTGPPRRSTHRSDSTGKIVNATRK
jgi:hypothetical protein